MSIGISQVESWDLTSLSTSATDLRSGSGTLGAQAAAVINQLGSLDTNWDGESRTAAEIETRDRAGATSRSGHSVGRELRTFSTRLSSKSVC